MSDLLAGAVTEHPDGAVLSVTVVPRAGHTAIERAEPGSLRVRVAAPPVDGAANLTLLRFLADAVDRPRSSLHLIAGQTGRRKRILFANASVEAVVARLVAHLPTMPPRE